MVDNMETLYKDDTLEIQSYDFKAKHSNGVIDFFIFYKGIGYSCSAICLKDVEETVTRENFFWSISSIILKQVTKDSIVKAVLDIVNDKSLCLDDLFIRLDA